MKNRFIPLFLLLFYTILHSQIGINNQRPVGAFHVDASSNNSKITDPGKEEQKDDFVISKTGVVSIGTTTPSPYSALEIESDKGVRLPQLTNEQRDALDASSSSSTTKKNGLTIYNTTTKCINYWALSEWVELCGVPKCTPVDGTPIINPSSPNLIIDEPTVFTVSEVKNATSYDWYVNKDFFTNTKLPTLSYTPTSTSSVSITVIAKGCDDSSTQESAAVTAIPCAPVKGTPVIELKDNLFSVSGVENAIEYIWYVNDNPVSQGKLPTFYYVTTNPETVSVMAIGCNNTTTGKVYYQGNSCKPIQGTPVIKADSNLIVGDPTIFKVEGVENADYYTWIVNGEQQDNKTNTFSYTPLTTDPVSIYVIAHGCENSKAISASYEGTPCKPIKGTPSITADSNLTVDKPTTFSISGLSGEYPCKWFVNGAEQIGQTGMTFSYTPTSTAPVSIYAEITDCNGTKVTTTSYLGTPTVACTPMTGTLSINPANSSANTGQDSVTFTAENVTNAINYKWVINNNQVYSGPSNTYSFYVNTAQINTIKVTATDDCGNMQTATTNLNSLPEAYTCKSTGRYLIGGTGCKQYVNCVATPAGLRADHYVCPTTSKFYTVIRQCTDPAVTTNFTCPY